MLVIIEAIVFDALFVPNFFSNLLKFAIWFLATSLISIIFIISLESFLALKLFCRSSVTISLLHYYIWETYILNK